MTREEEIEQTANIYGCRQGLELKPFGIKFFKAGAEWADNTLIEKALNYFAPYIQDNSGGYEREEILNGFKKLFKS